LLAEVDAVVEVEAVVVVAAEGPRVEEEGSLLRPDPRVRQAGALGRAEVLAKLRLLDLQVVVHLPQVGQLPVAARRVKQARQDSAPQPAEERRMSLPGTARRLVN
jgi:hypothetical protein